jgi:eukaryotic-like serine/threonine-protein kinase
MLHRLRAARSGPIVYGIEVRRAEQRKEVRAGRVASHATYVSLKTMSQKNALSGVASRTLGGSLRYEPILELASGGMATVFVGHARGAFGFRQLVALKRPHAHLLSDPQFRNDFIAEARVASALRHANIVDVRDVDIADGTVILVMDYIEGASVGELLSRSVRLKETVPIAIALRICLDALAGLGAAHQLCDADGNPYRLVHRDISPQNILVGLDGIARLTDFGIAKFVHREGADTMNGVLKGKYGYMPPEYVRGASIDQRFDIFSMGIVLWEMLAGKRLFRGKNDAETLRLIAQTEVPALATEPSSPFSELDPILARAIAQDPMRRFANADEMTTALRAYRALEPANQTQVGAWVNRLVGHDLVERRRELRSLTGEDASHARLAPAAQRTATPEVITLAERASAPHVHGVAEPANPDREPQTTAFDRTVALAEWRPPVLQVTAEESPTFPGVRKRAAAFFSIVGAMLSLVLIAGAVREAALRSTRASAKEMPRTTSSSTSTTSQAVAGEAVGVQTGEPPMPALPVPPTFAKLKPNAPVKVATPNGRQIVLTAPVASKPTPPPNPY